MMTRLRCLGFVLGFVLLGDVLRAEAPPTPAESLAALRLADPALRIGLVASEPDVVSPVAVAWDEFGALYVVEMTDYPNAETGGRVKRLEDRDGDGRYERVTVFADGLHFPTGALSWNGGLLVTAAPDLLFFKDRDGDGRAEVRRVILTGFAEGNQQLRVNSPTWGRDNRFYLANGRSGGAVHRPEDPPGSAIPIARNDLRVDPATGSYEVVSGFSQFGLPRNDWGDRFPSWNTVPLRHVVLEPGELSEDSRINAGVADILELSDGGRVYSLAPAQTRFNGESVAYFNATCGSWIYRADRLGPDYHGDAFVCEPLSSLVHHRQLKPNGATYTASRVENDREFLASSHPWFRPVNLATSPDGSLVVVDFCRAWVEHPAFVPEKRRGEADFREGHDRGRLWRITRRDGVSPTSRCLPGTETQAESLVAHFEHANAWCRDTAQRLLVERGDRRALPSLLAMVEKGRSPLARVHALWTLDGLGIVPTATLRRALSDPDPRLREQALRLAAREPWTVMPEIEALLRDSDLRVRLRAIVALGQVDQPSATEALVDATTRALSDRWSAEAILSAASKRPIRFFGSMAKSQPSWYSDSTPAVARFLERLAERVGQQRRLDEVTAVLEAIERTPCDGARLSLLLGLSRGLGGTKASGPSEREMTEDELGKVGARVSRSMGDLGAICRETTRPAWVRAVALELRLLKSEDGLTPLLLDMLGSSQPIELQAVAAQGVARSRDQELTKAILDRWESYSLGTRRILVGSFVGAPERARSLVEAVVEGRLSKAEVDPTSLEALRRLDDADLRRRLADVFKATPDSDRSGVLAKYEPSAEKAGNAAKGRLQFEKHCKTCHNRDGSGPKVGPDLLSVAGKPARDLLVAILDPSREAPPDGRGVVVATTGGLTLTGLLVEETPNSIRLRRAEGIEDVLPRSEIEALRPTGRSLMPDGFEQSLSPDDLADLLAYLRGPRS